MFTITFNAETAAAALNRLPDASKKALKTASRKALQAAKREAINKVKARYTSPVSLFSSSLSIKNSASGGTLTSRGPRNPLYKFKATPKGRITTRGRYIHAEVVKGQGANLPTAFRTFANQNIFERLGAKRLPIKKLKSVAAPQMLNAPQVREPVMQKIEREFFNNLEF